MDFIKEDLQIRGDEVIEFLELIKFFEATEKIRDDSGNLHTINSSLRNSLKAKVFLLLYNLIESTMRESIRHIHDTLDAREITFNQLRNTFRKEILKRVKSDKVGLDELYNKTVLDISTQLLAATFKSNAIFSGNIDHQEICSQAKIYGFSTQTEYGETRHGSNLKTIKDKRNDLAHGNSSFAEIGGNYSHAELENFTNEVLSYLESITTHIANYLSQRDYLASQGA